MTATAATATPADGNAFAQNLNPRTPKKPEVTGASLEVLVAHYNSQVPAFNEAAAVAAEGLKKLPDNLQPMQVIELERALAGPEKHESIKAEVIDLIKRQNRRLGKTVRRRALELLEARIKGPDGKPQLDTDGRSVGLKYEEVLSIIRDEFPEASTSVACLRWYVVHLRMDANDLGLPWPDLPQIRPRAKGSKKEQA